MFNLEQSIAEWRRQMTAGGITDSDVVAELESHLREDVERRMRSGATEEQAFREATVQLGAAGQIQQEFNKVPRLQARLSQTTVRIGCVGIAVFLLLTQGWTLLDYNISLAERIAGLACVTATALYLGFLPYLNQLRPGVSGLALRRAVGKTCSVIVPVWICLLFLNVAGFTHFPSGILMSTACWLLFFALAITGVVLALGTEPEVLNPWAPGVWQTFDVAAGEACRFRHSFIGTEHLLLGLLQAEGSSIPVVLGRMGVGCESVRAEIEKIVGSGGQSPANRAPTPTPRAQKALQFAIQEARKSKINQVEVEHVFLGLIREGGGVAAVVLNQLGVNIDKAREEISQELSRRKDSDV